MEIKWLLWIRFQVMMDFGCWPLSLPKDWVKPCTGQHNYGKPLKMMASPPLPAVLPLLPEECLMSREWGVAVSKSQPNTVSAIKFYFAVKILEAWNDNCVIKEAEVVMAVFPSYLTSVWSLKEHQSWQKCWWLCSLDPTDWKLFTLSHC